MLKPITLIITAMALAMSVESLAQELVWDVDFHTVLNNREGGDEQTPDQTFFFTRLEPEVGLSFTSGKVTHALMGGVAWYQPMNDRGSGYKVLPAVYYHGATDNGWDLSLGLVPRRHMAYQLPRFMWSDSLNYCTPVVRGLVASYGTPGKGTWTQAVVDWRQMQTTNTREAFDVTFSGGTDLGRRFYVLGNIQYNHLAKRKNAPENEGVNDDMTINPMVGWRVSPDAPLKVNVEAGAVVQMQRCRAMENGWQTPAGFLANIKGQWRWLDVEESFFQGKDLFPLYDMFGSELNLGDPYYRSKTYSRTDVRAHLWRNSVVDVNASLIFHASDRCTGFWQQVTCRFYFTSKQWRQRHQSNHQDDGVVNTLF